MRDFVTFFYGEVTLDTVLKRERIPGEFGGHFEYQESTRDRTRIVVLKHGRGMKWSIHYEEQLRYEVEKCSWTKGRDREDRESSYSSVSSPIWHRTGRERLPVGVSYSSKAESGKTCAKVNIEF